MITENYNAQLAYSKISEAVTILATHPGDVRSRLYEAYPYLREVSTETLPSNIRFELDWIREQLTKYPSRYEEGTLCATLRRIRNKTGIQIAKRIILVQALLESLVSNHS